MKANNHSSKIISFFLKKTRLWFVFICASLILFFVFQNCGKAGFDSGSSGGPYVNPITYSDAPFPYEVNINQVGFMSCPSNGVDPSSGDGLQSIIFTFRFGAFDYSAPEYSALPNASGRSIQDQGKILNGGIRVNQAFIDYVKRKIGNLNTNSIEKALAGSSFVSNYLTSAFLDKYNIESTSSQYFKPFVKYLTGALGSLEYANTLANSVLIDPIGTRNVSFFPSASANRQALFLTQNYYGRGREDMINFKGYLQNNQFYFGFTASGDAAGQNRPVFISADSNNKNQFYGKALAFSLASSQGNRLDILPNNGIQVQDTTTRQTEASSWNCLKFDIVRDADRRDSTTYNLLPGGFAQDSLGLYSKFGCPPQDISDFNNPTELALLKMVRKFLPPEQWDVNTRFKCVVPKTSANVCYETSNLIIYSGDCGSSPKNECSATVNICYRYN